MEYSFENLLKLCAKLRGENGCPWDKKQTILSLKKCVQDESQEVVEAIEKNDMKNLEEEIGDLLFSLILITQVAKEENYFNMELVLERITEKIISRHTWVFGEDKAKTAEEALLLWKKNKEIEKLKKQK